jgi:glycosyltransferase involved in cell wall biosynthesis
MKKKNILFYTEVYEIGGSEKFFFDLITNLNDDYELNVISNNDFLLSKALKLTEGKIKTRKVSISNIYEKNINSDSNNTISYSRKNNIYSKISLFALNRKNKLEKLFFYDIFKKILKRIFQVVYILKAIPGITRVLLDNRGKVDTIHINNGGYPAAESSRIMIILARLLGYKNIIMTVHSLAQPRKKWHLIEIILDLLVHHCVNSIIVVSDEALKTITMRRGFSEKKVKKIHNGIKNIVLDSSKLDQVKIEFNNPDKYPVLSMAGFIETRKGVGVLIDAVVNLKKRDLNPLCLIVGIGADLDFYKNMVNERNLNENIRFTGYRLDVNYIYKISDIIIFPSIGYESLPYVIMEAMALSKPVIASKVGGVAEMVEDGNNGYLIEADNSELLADSIIQMLSDKENFLEMGKKGQQIFENRFSINRMVNEYASLY